MARLTLDHLYKAFGPTVVPVRDVSLEVKDGDFLALLGPSGCGKSTLLRLIAGLETPSQGEIFLDERRLTPLPPGARDMAMVFQSYALYPHLSIFENIASPLRVRKVPPQELQRRVTQTAESLALTPLLKRKPAQLSGGQRQRAALARALVRQPEVFLLDEPLSNLDALLREQVRGEMKQLFKAQNRPVVYVTHDQTEALTLATRIAVLKDGRVQQLAPPLEIYQAPANQFVAGFVGSPPMNFFTLPCDGRRAFFGALTLPLPAPDYPQKRIILGLRPEDLQPPTEPGPDSLGGAVILRELLGKDQLVTLQIEGAPWELKVLLPQDWPLSDGALNVQIPLAKCHWFRYDDDPAQRPRWP
ncbi:MAG: ATP-binding cassette domain-containing protein [Cyanobacteria bacterium RI_101]|nr:ATP-binding cassette domain-containing protein [Cyanobacteria bacterium RI_101]